MKCIKCLHNKTTSKGFSRSFIMKRISSIIRFFSQQYCMNSHPFNTSTIALNLWAQIYKRIDIILLEIAYYLNQRVWNLSYKWLKLLEDETKQHFTAKKVTVL